MINDAKISLVGRNSVIGRGLAIFPKNVRKGNTVKEHTLEMLENTPIACGIIGRVMKEIC